MVAAGFELVREDQYQWYFAHGDDGFPIVVPKRGAVLAAYQVSELHAKLAASHLCTAFHDAVETETKRRPSEPPPGAAEG